MSFFSGPAVDHALDPGAKRIIRPHYHGQREKDLRKLLKDAGLSSIGSRDRLVERHTQWVNLWNANVDASPTLRISTSLLRARLRDWERKVLDGPSASSNANTSVNVNSNTNTNTNANAQANTNSKSTLTASVTSHAWIRAHRDQFRELTRAARASARRDRERLQEGPASHEKSSSPLPSHATVEDKPTTHEDTAHMS